MGSPIHVEFRAPGNVIITGSIASFGDYEIIKNCVDEQIEKGVNELVFHIIDSTSINSSTIGYFIKIKNYPNIQSRIEVYKPKLFQTFTDLNMVDALGITKHSS